jgi:deoxyribonuclease V
MEHELLQTNLSFDEAASLQEKYRQKIKNYNSDRKKKLDLNKIKWIVGVDVSYYNENLKEWGIAAAVLWNFQLNRQEECSFSKGIVTFPYKPGFLGFRECNLLTEAITKLSETPDVIMCDGHGIIHPRRFGVAVQLGLILNNPTFGVAKNPFTGFSEWKVLKRIKGNKTPILAEDPQNLRFPDREALGYAVCLNDGMKPMFVSVGYNISLNVAIKIALKTTITHKQPEPLYLADYFSRKGRK